MMARVACVQSRKLWPLILLELALQPDQFVDVPTIARKVRAHPKSVYASMSSMNAMAGVKRHPERAWLKAERYWQRNGRFRITPVGKRVLQKKLRQT